MYRITKNNEVRENFIEFRQVSKWFDSPAGRFNALQNINLRIGKGEQIAVVGKSGSGKSTLLNMLTGIDHPSYGDVYINNTLVHNLSENRLASWRGANIGIVFQFFQLVPTLTILENLLLAMEFVNVIPKKERVKRAKALLYEVDIGAHIYKLPSALSVGQQQRAAIARALANDPPILVADEPTGNLDSATAASIAKLFSNFAMGGKTIIIVTHEDTTNSKFDRVITMNDGEILVPEIDQAKKASNIGIY